MALLRSSLGQDSGPLVRGDGVMLRSATMADYSAWAELRTLSRDHLVPWEPTWTRDELTRTAFRRRVRHYQREAREDLGYGFLIFADASSQAMAATYGGVRGPALSGKGTTLIGGLTLSNVRRGVTQAATLGYWLGAPFTGRGLMSASLSAITAFAFDVLRLHRIEAAVMPSNLPSIRLIERCGFQREGLARRYLKINGTWEDHLSYALLAEDNGRPVPGDLE